MDGRTAIEAASGAVAAAMAMATTLVVSRAWRPGCSPLLKPGCSPSSPRSRRWRPGCSPRSRGWRPGCAGLSLLRRTPSPWPPARPRSSLLRRAAPRSAARRGLHRPVSYFPNKPSPCFCPTRMDPVVLLLLLSSPSYSTMPLVGAFPFHSINMSPTPPTIALRPSRVSLIPCLVRCLLVPMAAACSTLALGLLRPAPLAAPQTFSCAKPLRSFVPRRFACAALKPMASLSAVSAARSAVTAEVEHLPDNVRLLYAALQGGELSPGVMTSEDMLLLAHRLANLRVDSFKAGFSPQDLEVVKFNAIQVIDTLRSIVGDGKDGPVLVSCGLFGCNESDIGATATGIMFVPTRNGLFTLPVKPDQVLDIAKEAVSNALSLGIHKGQRQVVMAGRCGQELVDSLYTGVNTQESCTMTSEMVQEQSGLHGQRHKATVGANVIAHESEIHQDLNGMSKLKGTSEITSSGDVVSTHENEFDNGKLSESHTVGTKLVELPASLGSWLHSVAKFADLVYTRQGSILLMWHVAQPCLRVIPFVVPVIVFTAGVAAMCYGTVAALKAAQSTSHSA